VTVTEALLAGWAGYLTLLLLLVAAVTRRR
jgi:hypothetical protein